MKKLILLVLVATTFSCEVNEYFLEDECIFEVSGYDDPTSGADWVATQDSFTFEYELERIEEFEDVQIVWTVVDLDNNILVEYEHMSKTVTSNGNFTISNFPDNEFVLYQIDIQGTLAGDTVTKLLFTSVSYRDCSVDVGYTTY